MKCHCLSWSMCDIIYNSKQCEKPLQSMTVRAFVVWKGVNGSAEESKATVSASKLPESDGNR